jgi:hypothetical protein
VTSFLVVAVTGVGILGLLNLWLTVATARRLREQAEQSGGHGARRVPRPPVGLPLGTLAPGFSVTTVSGAQVCAADLRGARSLIGFFTPGCPACRNQVSPFLALARSLPGGPGHALAVVSDGGRLATRAPEHDADQLVGELTEAEAAQVVRGPSAGAAEVALAITGYPSFILLGADGRIEAGAHGIAGLDGLSDLASST